jgi:hypothetical protein
MSKLAFTDILIELQYEEFVSFVTEHRLDEDISTINEFAIPGKLKKIWKFIKDLASNISIKIMDLVKLFLDKVVFKFFAKIKFSFKYLFALVKKGFKYYKDVIKAIGDYLAKTRVGKWTEEKLKALDKFLATHPKTKRIAGVAVAALLIYIWLNMTFTGDADFDFDMTDMIAALGGSFTLSTLFAGASGMTLLMLFATGAMGLSFPWPGPQHVQFIGAVIYGSAKMVGKTLRRNK